MYQKKKKKENTKKKKRKRTPTVESAISAFLEPR